MRDIRRTAQEKSVDKELIDKGRDAMRDFDASQELTVQPKKRESKLISIRLPLEMMQALRDIAAKTEDAGYQRIIKRYIQEGLERANRKELTKEGAVLQELELQNKMLELQQQQISQLNDRLKTIQQGPRPIVRPQQGTSAA